MSIKSKLSLLNEIKNSLASRKKYWMLPIVIMLLLIGMLVVFAESSALGPLIYTIF